MNNEFPLTKYFNLYIWKLFHSLINYFFTIHFKKKYNVNSNCYIFLKKLSKNLTVLINQITSISSEYFDKISLNFIKFSLNINNPIPQLYISNINYHIKLLEIKKFKNLFKIWNNSDKSTITNIKLFDDLISRINQYILIRIDNINFEYKNFRIICLSVKVTKNNNKTRIYIKKIKIYYNDYYIGFIRDFKFSYDSITKKTNIYSQYLVIFISNLFLKYDIMCKFKEIYNLFDTNSDSKLPNTFFKKIIIRISINNHISFILDDSIIENNIVKCNLIIKVWKKDICWMKQCIINLISNNFEVKNVRLRLFKSTADKIYKTFRPIYKQYLSDIKCKSKIITPKKFIKDSIIKPKFINNNYLSSISVLNNEVLTKKNINSILLFNDNYLDKFNQTNTNIFTITKCTIDFKDLKSSFILQNLKLDRIISGIQIAATRWQFINQNTIYFDKYNSSDNTKFIIEYKDSCLYLYPYPIYINISPPIYCKTFSRFTEFISRMNDIFSIKKKTNCNYTHELFYIHSTRILCNYTPQKIKLDLLFSGKYSELINILTLENLDLIITEINIRYPKNGSYILNGIINNILDDIFRNNFDEIIKCTPIGKTYQLKKELQKIPFLANKISSIIW